jgi:hypothetical protein
LGDCLPIQIKPSLKIAMAQNYLIAFEVVRSFQNNVHTWVVQFILASNEQLPKITHGY